MLENLDKNRYIGKIDPQEHDDDMGEDVIVDITHILDLKDSLGNEKYHFHSDLNYSSQYPHICFYSYSIRDKFIRHTIMSVDHFEDCANSFTDASPELLAEAITAYKTFKLIQIVEK